MRDSGFVLFCVDAVATPFLRLVLQSWRKKRSNTNTTLIESALLPERKVNRIPGWGCVMYYKYIHADGRVSYPLCFIFSSPMGCKPEQQMMYAGSKNRLIQAAELTKVDTAKL
uniref:Glia maturation factor, gamma n=1 Tax=Nothobranchius furzeri TaxID=105023 RepID=A0A1A8AES9_NOTFU